MFIIALVIGLFLLLLKIVKYISLRKYEWYRIYMTIIEKVYYNLLIRYFLQATLKMQIAACTTIVLVSWITVSEISQGIISIVLMTALTLQPLLFIWVLYKNY